MDTAETLLVIAGLTLITVVTRGFFVLPKHEWPMPAWLKEGLRYAPLGALAAVLAPDLLLTNGQFISTWRDARLFGVVAATGWFAWRRDMLGTIVAGTTVMLILRLGLGW